MDMSGVCWITSKSISRPFGPLVHMPMARWVRSLFEIPIPGNRSVSSLEGRHLWWAWDPLKLSGLLDIHGASCRSILTLYNETIKQLYRCYYLPQPCICKASVGRSKSDLQVYIPTRFSPTTHGNNGLSLGHKWERSTWSFKPSTTSVRENIGVWATTKIILFTGSWCRLNNCDWRSSLLYFLLALRL